MISSFKDNSEVISARLSGVLHYEFRRIPMQVPELREINPQTSGQ